MTAPIEIDGSLGEGGGQVLRTALSLSAATGRPVRIFNIRARRPTPGLAHQHLTCIKATKEIASAAVAGARLGCETLEFEPARDEVIPFTCPKCDERAVYPWQYCYDCQMRFIPQPVRHQPGGPLKLPMHMSCPQCGGENVTGFVPGVPDQQPVGDYPLPQWSP